MYNDVRSAGQSRLSAVAELKNDFYIGNRPPLLPSPLIKLPIGAIEPQGWVRRQLELQADGFHGNLTEISRFLKKEGNAWLSPAGEGSHGWEVAPPARARTAGKSPCTGSRVSATAATSSATGE